MSFKCRTLAAFSLMLSLICCIANAATEPTDQPERPFPHPPAWVADQTLYEVNLRQFSSTGDVNGFRTQLPRLKALGAGTLWFMPVNPIGVSGRVGKLGSPYAVRDYRQFNPELGTFEQFKAAVDEAHALGMYVIMDWVAPHTALDHPWVTQHPDWYKHDAAGNLVPPLPAWHDVAALNYDSPALRTEMIESMAYWIRSANIDGFRCDSAEFVPLDFWCQARDALRKIKPIFLLAEGAKPELLHYAFDACYAWNLLDNTEGIVKGSKNTNDLANYLRAEAPLLPAGTFRLNFTTNHDKNAWEGAPRKLLGDGVDAFTVLTFTVPGMPLIYNGQEAGLDRQINFFDRDPIQWHDDPSTHLFQSLTQLKRNNFALWSIQSAPVQFLDSNANSSIFAFQRIALGDRIVVLLNLSAHAQKRPVPPEAAGLHVALSEKVTSEGTTLTFAPWSYRVWSTTH